MKNSRKRNLHSIISKLLIFIMLFSTIPFQGISNALAVENSNNLEESQVETAKNNESIDSSSVEVESLRNETTKVYLNTDGSYTAEAYTKPIHYKKDNKWHDIDNTLIENSTQELENKSNSFKVKFPKKPKKENKSKLYTFSTKGHEAVVEFIDNTNTKPKVHNGLKDTVSKPNKNKVKYENLYDGVTFDYAVDSSKIKENIILDSYRGKNTFQFNLLTQGLKAAKKEDGTIEFTDSKTGEFLFYIQRPYMYDSSKSKSISEQVTQEITPTESGFTLTITADEAYLKDPNRVYPVVIDPWIDNFKTSDAFVASDPDYGFGLLDYLSVGSSANFGKTRTYLRWNPLPEIPDAEIVGGSVGIYQSESNADVPISLHRLTQSYSTSTIKWTNQPSYNPVPEATVSRKDIGYMYFPVNELLKDWYNKKTSPFGVVLKYEDSQEGTAANKLFHATEWVNPNGTLVGEPKLVISYRPKDLLGMTDYWAYSPDLLQGAGTSVVNLINGNMVYDIPILSLPGRTDAFNLKLVYNSRSAHSDAYGNGWTLNAQRKLIPNSDKSIVEYIDENGTQYHFSKNQYDSTTTYSAPEGTAFELTNIDNGYILKQPDERILEFDSSGRNTKITDEKGNKILYSFDGNSSRLIKISERFGSETTGKDLSLTYNTTGLLERVTDFRGTDTVFSYNLDSGLPLLTGISYAANRSEKKDITFSYNTSGKLENIIDASGRKGTIEYDTDNRVTKIVDPRSETIFSQFLYPSQTETIFVDSKGNKTYYKNDSDQAKGTVNIVEITEDYQGTDPSTTKYEWDKNNLVKEISPNKDTGLADGTLVNTATYDEKNNIVNTSAPNNFSVTNEYDSKSNLVRENIDGGGFYRYRYDSLSNLLSTTNPYQITNYSSYDKYGNPVTQSNSTYLALNKLLNSDFEQTDTSNLPNKWSRSSKGQLSVSTTHLYGKKSGQITLSSTDGGGYYYQRVPVRENGTYYTMSAYIKTNMTSGRGAQLRVYPMDANSQLMKDANGNVISYVTPALSGTNDWTRINTGFSIPTGTKILQFETLVMGVGTAQFDGVQLSYGSNLGRFYNNENAGMEEVDNPTAPTSVNDWNLKTLGTGDGPSKDTTKHGNYSFKIKGVSANRSLGQDVQVGGKAGESLSLSGWAYGDGTNENGGDFSLKLSFIYSDGTEEAKSIPFIKKYPANPSDTNVDKWQFVKKSFKASKDFSSVKIYAVYNNQTGAAYFDNILLEEGPSDSTFSYSSDGINLTSQTDAFGNKATFQYNENGDNTSVTTATGKQTKFGYDYLDRLKSTTLIKGSESDPENISVSYEYDTQDNLKEKIDARGNKTSYTYNAINQLEFLKDPLSKFQRFIYNENGNIQSVEMGQLAGSEESVKSKKDYKYDGKNRLIEQMIDQSLMYKYSYDDLDNLTRITLKDGSFYSYTYDDSQRLIVSKEPSGYKIENQYENNTASNDVDVNNFGLRKSFIETIGSTVESTNYTYDVLKRLRSVEGPKKEKTTFYYNEESQPIRIEQGKTNIFYEYNAVGNLTKQTIKGSKLLSLIQTYDSDGNIKSITNESKVESFNYDFANRLDSWNNNGEIITYNYDKSGNLVNPNGKTLTFNSANEIEGYMYDEIGNLIQDDKKKYFWNTEGKLIKITDLNGKTFAEYSYSPNGLRKTKTVGSETYHYYYDSTDLIRVTNNNNETLWTFTWTNGKPVSMTNREGKSFYYITNYHGDIIQIVDENGSEVANYSYDPWGKMLSLNESPEVKEQPLGYASYIYDRESEMYYLKARYYETSTARFISRDSNTGNLDNPLSQNLYIYVNSNPVIFSDPSGHKAIPVQKVGSNVSNEKPKSGYNITNWFLALLRYNENISRNHRRDLYWFYRKVKNGAPWDYKQKWEGTYYLFGRKVTDEDLGNIHYGYQGTAAGISRLTLGLGGGYAQLKANTWRWRFFVTFFDDPGDSLMIQYGIQIYSKYHKYSMPVIYV
ncbi:DNRLRE domain-containing protein [Metabacillus fastidiosus]|uniref:DNRLRE domain-containing protein n=1 Tax=Metabacillus fastidiosus TaxID=1458 RepID=A0ABU6P488_9BACI|nr:DNRLRE domain-containing protein [Metabacillus fastidiosus]